MYTYACICICICKCKCIYTYLDDLSEDGVLGRGGLVHVVEERVVLGVDEDLSTKESEAEG